MTLSIDIEDLLIWAYRDQCVDRVAKGFTPQGPSASVAGSLGMYVALGTRVDGGSAAARAMGVRLPDDAAIVHDAVLRLGEMWIDDAGATGDAACGDVTIWDAGLLAAARAQIARCRRSGRDVLTLADGTCRFVDAAGLVGLIIPHARLALRPDWGARLPRGRRPGDASPIDRRGRPRALVDVMAAATRERARYACWHAALGVLAVELAGVLAGYDPTGPAAPATPWQNRPTGARREVPQSDAGRPAARNRTGGKPLISRMKMGA